MRRTWRGTQTRERGAVTTIVAVLMTCGVVFGMLTISVDIGQLMYERGQQQNSADASAYSLARSCASGAATCTPGANSLSDINNANSNDNLNAFQSQCGVNLPSGSTLQNCAAAGIVSTGDWTDCSPTLPASVAGITGLPYVEVRTKSQSSGGSFIKNFFAQMSGGKSTSTVGACSRAAWGSAAPPAVLPITMSVCAWATAMGTSLGSTTPPAYPAAPVGAIPGYGGVGQPAWPTSEATIYTKDGDSGCPASAGGGSAAGNFNQLLDAGGCTTNSPVAGADGSIWIAGDTGNPTPCKKNVHPNLSDRRGTVVYIPIFNCTSRTAPTPYVTPTCQTAGGSGLWYRVVAYAAFYLSGFHFSGDGQPSYLTGSDPCGGSNRCVSGWFVQAVIPAGSLLPPPGGQANLGVTSIVSAG